MPGANMKGTGGWGGVNGVQAVHLSGWWEEEFRDRIQLILCFLGGRIGIRNGSDRKVDLGCFGHRFFMIASVCTWSGLPREAPAPQQRSEAETSQWPVSWVGGCGPDSPHVGLDSLAVLRLLHPPAWGACGYPQANVSLCGRDGVHPLLRLLAVRPVEGLAGGSGVRVWGLPHPKIAGAASATEARLLAGHLSHGLLTGPRSG